MITWKIHSKKLISFYFSLQCFPVIDMIGSSRPIWEKKLQHKKLPWLLSSSGGMPLMMNTNSKILSSQDSNLSCYSPSTLAFCVPAFYLSSFMILVEGRFPFPKNRHFLCDGGQRRDRRIPPPEICPQQTTPGRLSPLKLGLGNSPGDNFLRNNSPSSTQKEAAFQG